MGFRIYSALIILILSGCGEDRINDADTELTVYLAPNNIADHASLTLPSGTRVQLSDAFIALAGVELMPCASATAQFNFPVINYHLSFILLY